MAQTASWSNYPLEETNGNARSVPKRGDTTNSVESGKSGKMKAVRRSPSDLYNIMSDSEETKQRRQSLKATNNTSMRKRPRNVGGSKTKDQPEDNSAWIHRDKLAQIEIQEMVEAGIDVRQARRSMSAGPDSRRRSSRSVSRSRRPVSDEPPDEPVPSTFYNGHYGSFEDPEKVFSTPHATPGGEEYFDPDIDTEFRTPEELAAAQESIRSNVLRPSTSRIPISKASPVPVPLNVVDRESPLPRSRNGSGAWSGNWDEMQYARRARSNSIGSQAVLDEEGVRTPSRPGSSHLRSSNENSPPKARVPNKATPKSGARKGSTPSSTADRPTSSSGKERKGSVPKDQRPVSRGQPNNGRPTTSQRHAPEGEPPWIAGMYKPDPRLPPDQQMLPTHAKRMMQEQWEKEGRTGTAYDRELNLLNDNKFPAQKQKPQPLNLNKPGSDMDNSRLSPRANNTNQSTPNSANMNAWPLTPKSDQGSNPPASPRPGTSGGLRLTPTIQAPPAIERSPGSPLPMTPHAQSPVRRMPELDEKQEVQPKKGGCGCCVMM